MAQFDVTVVNITPIIDNAKFQNIHRLTIFWCAYVIIFDGYDLAVLGVILPKLMADWGITAAQAGLLGSYTLIGMMFGALLLGPLSDKIGKKKVITLCVITFSVFTFLCGFTVNANQFGWCRFISGIGLGGVMPNVTALTSEYSPKNKRSLMVGLMFSGYSIGGIWAAILGIYLIPLMGWQSIFYVAIFPVFFLPWMLSQLPESAAFLIKTRQKERLKRALERVSPDYIYQPGTEFVSQSTLDSGQVRMSIGNLFSDNRTLSTLMFWLVFFISLYVIYGMTSWLPKLMLQAGYPLNSSLTFLVALHSGTVAGALSSCWLMDKVSGRTVLIGYFLLGAAAIALLGAQGSMSLLYVLLIIAGASTIGTQIAMTSYVARFYPCTMTSTGLGWGLGIGRIGAILGPFAGGVLIDLELTLQQNFMAFALPSLLAAGCMFFVNPRLAAS
ncbi:MFS transporter [Serratia nevei]|uniref:MFS transporter n=1 Tax=Serratia nevei TaxID=2703794 RepID=UPI0020A0439B|nr:MFS transporter [Serratia nevei]MCP1106596.1 MFS transporter [Serratia nevei]